MGGEPCDSRIAESELGITTGDMPPTSPFLIDYDANASLETGGFGLSLVNLMGAGQ